MPSPTPHHLRHKVRGAALALVAGSTLVATAALAVPTPHPALAYHALDGYVVHQSGNTADHDWDDIFVQPSDATEPVAKSALPSGVISADFTRDFLSSGAPPNQVYANGDDTYYATGSKDTLNPSGNHAKAGSGWQCKHTNNATDKGDFSNGYGYAANVSVGGVNHILFFFGFEKDSNLGTNNLGVWLLQDGTVGCASSSNTVDFTGDHVDDDLFAVVSYDSGGKVGTAQGFTWNGGFDGALNTTPAFSETNADCTLGGVGEDAKFCITTNKTWSANSPWWSPQKSNRTKTADIDRNDFSEGFIDITNVFGSGSEPCFAQALADTRSSTSPTATLYDFVRVQSPTCGPLVLKKYYDKDADGTQDAPDPNVPGSGDPALSGWEFKVFAHGDDPSTDTPVYDVTTGTDGTVSIPNVPFGHYDVYEVLKSSYYNTDPGNSASDGLVLVSGDFVKTAGSQTIVAGNACLITKTVTVTGAPTGAALALTYKVNNGTAHTVNMTADGTSRTASITGLRSSDVLDLSYAYQSGGPSGSITIADDEVLSDYTDTSGVGTACAKANSTAFPYVTLSGTKYKDKDADGTKDADDPTTTTVNEADQGIGGFQFVLHQGTVDGSQVGTTQTSAADGTYSFSNVAPGTYWVTENARTGWRQTAPTGATAATKARQVTVNLGATSPVSIGDFLNAPLTNISVTVHPQTGSSYGDISCTGKTPVSGTAGQDSQLTANDLLVGTYTCTITISDP